MRSITYSNERITQSLSGVKPAVFVNSSVCRLVRTNAPWPPSGKGTAKFLGQIVHTAHVSSLSCSYGGHGSTPHFPNTEVSKAFPEWFLLWSTFTPVASLSTQIYSCLVPFELPVMRYPWYSRVHCRVGHTLRAGIIIRDPRFSALHTAHGTPR